MAPVRLALAHRAITMEYYVNHTAQSNGDHEVHTSDCFWLKIANSKLYLGNYTSCKDAVQKAKTYYPQSNGCKHCSELCHTS